MRSMGKAAALVLAGVTVALVIARSELGRTYYAHRGDLAHQLDAARTAPRYGVPHLLYVVNLATLGGCALAVVVWLLASVVGRSQARGMRDSLS